MGDQLQQRGFAGSTTRSCVRVVQPQPLIPQLRPSVPILSILFILSKLSRLPRIQDTPAGLCSDPTCATTGSARLQESSLLIPRSSMVTPYRVSARSMVARL